MNSSQSKRKKDPDADVERTAGASVCYRGDVNPTPLLCWRLVSNR